MIGISIYKTTPNDFEKIYPLLLDFDSPFTRDDWQRIFNYRWEGAQDHVGYHLEKNGEIVGFMGLIFSRRYKNDRSYQFCNITSLIVKPVYRAATLLLLRKLKSYSDTIFTCLGPIRESYQLMIALGFLPFENSYRIIPVFNGLFFGKKNMHVDESVSLIDKLDAENKRIVLDHANLKCKKILFDYQGECCLLIYSISRQTYFGITVTKLHLHYISSTVYFNKHIRTFFKFLKKRYGFFSAIYMSEHHLLKKNRLVSLRKKINFEKLRSKNFMHEIGVDALYSEVVLL